MAQLHVHRQHVFHKSICFLTKTPSRGCSMLDRLWSSSVLYKTTTVTQSWPLQQLLPLRIRRFKTPGSTGLVATFTVSSTLFSSGNWGFCTLCLYGTGCHLVTHSINIPPSDLPSVGTITLAKFRKNWCPIFILSLLCVILSNLSPDYFHALLINV
jgi:hypothetical protein